MPATTPPARYDLPWKTALTHAFRDFMAFFFPDIAAEIDWRRRPRFRDKELAGISMSGEADSRVADKLVEVCWRNGSVHWILIHIEVQAQRDASLPRRMLDYNYRIFNEHVLPVSSLVASHNPFAWITLAHLRTQQAGHDPNELYAAKWQCTKLMYQHGWNKKRILAMFYVINWMMVLPEPHQRRYWQAVLDLNKEHEMRPFNPLEQMLVNDGIKEGLEQSVRQGRVQGRQEGLELGRKEGALALLERQLTRRFGALPKTVQRKLAKADLPQLEAWSDLLAEAESLQQVFK
ncbi:DUF4351 domain-containing protein [Duganella sp. FT80W]|uniref:DUF4351 domain-containing protein n=1 Tax=Duganella guangzhouensis TaxID=2666084 RepID=A0A6I2KU96_9BURK|nr:DUF4351 domain-containing protein [Duganella guangzhouensis]MRW88617.1 DUF4351 domain-containing protein [Duganella guangzhouensis]